MSFMEPDGQEGLQETQRLYPEALSQVQVQPAKWSQLSMRKHEPISAIMRYVPKKKYQFDVTFAMYVMTPSEQLAVDLVVILMVVSTVYAIITLVESFG